MTFADTLNDYCDSLGCTNRELAAHCGISDSAISRYRKGGRTPDANGEFILKLASGIARLYEKADCKNPPSRTAIQHSLMESALEERHQGLTLCSRVNDLLDTLGIRNAELAAMLKIDPSYLSRIRSGQRVPADQGRFARQCARFAAKKCESEEQVGSIAALIGADFENADNQAKAIAAWLLS